MSKSSSRLPNHVLSPRKGVKPYKKIGRGKKLSSKKLEKPTSSSLFNSNASSRPLEKSRMSKSKGSVHKPNQLKAMPGLVHNAKDQSNLDKRQAVGCDGEVCDKIMKVNGALLDDDDVDVGAIQSEKQTYTMMTKRRKYIVDNQDEDSSGVRRPEDKHSVGNRCPHQEKGPIGDQSPQASGDDTTILKDCHAKVCAPSVNDYVYRSCCSKPIDEPIWRGILKMGDKECVSLAGHLSTKACQKVRSLSKSLFQVVQVTKVSRSKVWPKRWEASQPTDESIGMYFFPHEMRSNEDLDKLVNEVMENDLALQACVNDAEMLIFPSSLLPKRYQTIRTKHFLWGLFKPREVEAASLPHTQEATAVDTDVPDQGTATAFATGGAALLATEATPNHGQTESAPVPTEATTADHGQGDSGVGAPPVRVVGFVVRKTPRIERLIQEIQREGALMVAVQGGMIGAGSLPGDAMTRMQ